MLVVNASLEPDLAEYDRPVRHRSSTTDGWDQRLLSVVVDPREDGPIGKWMRMDEQHALPGVARRFYLAGNKSWREFESIGPFDHAFSG